MSDHPPHVLLVEDDRDTREMYSEYLSYSGMTVTEAATGQRALESVATCRPDVVVTDIAMPEMDGLELSRRLRQRGDTCNLPIIAVSGQVSPRAREAGADVVPGKPCEPDKLLHVIEDILKGRGPAPAFTCTGNRRGSTASARPRPPLCVHQETGF